MYLTTQSWEQKRSAWKASAIGLACSIVLLVILLIIGFPSDLWTPIGGGGFFRAFLTAGLIAAAGTVLAGPMVASEDWEVRSHTGSGPIINPLCSSVGFFAGGAWIAAIVLAIRFLLPNVLRMNAETSRKKSLSPNQRVQATRCPRAWPSSLACLCTA